jgi:chemotaxis receptor (MCP) glutamine deamidase CheD
MSATASARPTVGRMNCESALETLEAYGFAIAASSLGGKTGIHIVFNCCGG